MKTLTLSILQFNTFVKNILDAEEFLKNISVFGEVTNFKISGGNAYFDLKDDSAMLSCVKFGAGDLNIKNGDLITVFGRVNFYVKSGRLNFIVQSATAYGMGDLYQRFLMLKDKLEKEGLFREEIKKPIPKFAHKIGVVTSETGAVIRDIINVTKSKNPYTDIIVYPSKVQGTGAENEIASGIEYFNKQSDVDVIIVARGGGSIEDLSPFNTEKIVRAIYESQKPIISAVGHETDFTLCDFASDLRVPTPSVAAEVAVFDYNEQILKISEINKYNYNYITKLFVSKREGLVSLASLEAEKIKVKISEAKNKLSQINHEVNSRVQEIIKQKSNMLDVLTSVLSKQNPLEILKKGYSVVETNGKRISRASELTNNQKITIRFADGNVDAEVKKN